MILFFKAVAMWLVFLGLAFANGALRQLVTARFLGEAVARQGHTALLAAVFLLLARWFARTAGPEGLGGRIALGLSWAVGAVLFEIGLGRALGMPWEMILSDWNLAEGRLWLLVPLSLLLGPLIAGSRPRAIRRLR